MSAQGSELSRRGVLLRVPLSKTFIDPKACPAPHPCSDGMDSSRARQQATPGTRRQSRTGDERSPSHDERNHRRGSTLQAIYTTQPVPCRVRQGCSLTTMTLAEREESVHRLLGRDSLMSSNAMIVSKRGTKPRCECLDPALTTKPDGRWPCMWNIADGPDRHQHISPWTARRIVCYARSLWNVRGNSQGEDLDCQAKKTRSVPYFFYSSYQSASSWPDGLILALRQHSTVGCATRASSSRLECAGTVVQHLIKETEANAVKRGFGQASVLSKNRVELRQHPSEAAAREVHILGLPAEGNNAFPGGRCNLMRLRVGY